MKKLLPGPPFVNKFQHLIGLSFLKLTGWETVGTVPDIPKFVMLFALHTSNWDLFLLAILYSLGINFYWFGKKEVPLSQFAILTDRTAYLAKAFIECNKLIDLFENNKLEQEPAWH